MNDYCSGLCLRGLRVRNRVFTNRLETWGTSQTCFMDGGTELV